MKYIFQGRYYCLTEAVSFFQSWKCGRVVADYISCLVDIEMYIMSADLFRWVFVMNSAWFRCFVGRQSVMGGFKGVCECLGRFSCFNFVVGSLMVSVRSLECRRLSWRECGGVQETSVMRYGFKLIQLRQLDSFFFVRRYFSNCVLYTRLKVCEPVDAFGEDCARFSYLAVRQCENSIVLTS